MSARVHDGNGWFEVKGNPLSKVGIYDYSGAQIGAPAADAGKIFRVYRPAEELGSPDTVASFKLVPFISDHTMLGQGFTSTDERPPAGVVGEDVYFEGDTLYGNIKAYSPALAAEIKSGKTELSCGYRCRYEFTPGTFDGKPYDVVQRTIRGNHLALVQDGRMGPEVSILDELTFTVDAKEPNPVEEKLAEILAAIQAMGQRLDALEAAEKAEAPVAAEADAEGDMPPVKAEEDADAAPIGEEIKAIAADLEALAEGASMDAALRTRVLRVLKAKPTAAMDAATIGRLAALEGRPSMDEAAMFAALAHKTTLVERLSAHVGTFDHAAMTAQGVAEYGVSKLGLKGVPKGQETVALDAFLQARPAPGSAPTITALDAAPSGLRKRLAELQNGAK